MRSFALVIGCLLALAAPAFAQKAQIDAVNAKWIEFFNKGDFAGVASLYTEDATAFPPGSAMVKGRAAIAAMWKNMAEQVTDPHLTTLDVRPLGPAAAREIGTFSLKTKEPAPKEVSGKYVVIWEKVGADWKLAAGTTASNRGIAALSDPGPPDVASPQQATGELGLRARHVAKKQREESCVRNRDSRGGTCSPR
jgi:uncharacterized protein (TIGR02246 family)